jgi:uncharacterized protein YidB (DUF937 family)
MNGVAGRSCASPGSDHARRLWDAIAQDHGKGNTMSLFDGMDGVLKGLFGQASAAALPAMISSALAKTDFGDLQGLLTRLEAGGLEQQVRSWLGNGTNMPVSAEQLQSALAGGQIEKIASQFAVPLPDLLNLMAKHLPDIVDKASPKGTLE